MFTINVQSNQPPTVDAGSNQTVNLPANAVINAAVSDDGLPNPPGEVSIQCSQLSGPGTSTITVSSPFICTASFPQTGTYVLRVTADDGALTASDDVTVTVAQPTVTVTTEVRVAASRDDAEQRATGSVSLTSSDLEFVFDAGGDQTVGMRFNGITIPQGASIVDAYVQFQADEANSGATSLTIQGEAVDDAATFTGAGGNISSRPRTSASAAWSPPDWLSKGAAGLDQRTPDIGGVIQEVVNRPGWASGNSLVIIVTGSGERTAESFNGDAQAAPLLHVEYIMP